jgi:hypothetical protein
MTLPERARAGAGELRAAGAYPEPPPPPRPASPAALRAKLFAWAVLEPDATAVRSTRRLGAPVTALKQLLLRLLAQYHVQLIAEQSRFNVMLLRYVSGLETRIEELEARLDEAEQR